jgi:predicted lipoprotein with Yx(FWY)xxD motif
MWGAGAAVGVVLLAACGGSGGGQAAVAAGAGSKPAQTTVATHSGSLGTYLSDGKGRTLYEFAKDTAGTSTCTGSCATFWPPLIATGAPAAGSGVSAGQLGTTKRSDGSVQVTYAGHPLYYFAKDDGAGDTYGEGVNASGGLWWVLSPAGQAVKAANPAYSGYGNGY